MQEAEVVLSILKDKSKTDSNYVFKRMYRHFYNKSFYSGEQSNQMEFDAELSKTIDLLRHERYNPKINYTFMMSILTIIKRIIGAIYYSKLNGFASNIEITIFKTIEGMFKDNDYYIHLKVESKHKVKLASYIIDFIKRKIQDERFCNLLNEFVLSDLDNSMADDTFWLLFDITMKGYFENYCRIGEEILLAFSGKTEWEQFAKNDFYRSVKANDIPIISMNDIFRQPLIFDSINISKDKDKRVILNISNEYMSRILKPFTKNGKSNINSKRMNLPVVNIIKEYNKDIEQFKCKFENTKNFGLKFKKFRHYHYQSLLKTIACKEKTTVNKTIKKYGKVLKNEKLRTEKLIVSYNNISYIGFRF
jgi:hypothetical protein